MTKGNAMATIAAALGKLEDVSREFPETAVTLSRSIKEGVVAYEILSGALELSACEECGLTVEDGECEC